MSTSTSSSINPFYQLATVTKEWQTQADGAYNFINAIKRISAASGKFFFQGDLEGYLDGAAVARLPVVVIGAIQRLYRALSEKATLAVVMDVSHQLFDMSATLSYACAFFKKQSQSILNVAPFFDLLSDATDLGNYLIQWWNFSTIPNEQWNIRIHCIRAITAVATNAFICLLILNPVIVPIAVPVTIAVANSFFVVLTDYRQNYGCIN